jgi:ATP-binding cassette subfamily B protein
MQQVSRNRTTVIIAHRLQTARVANRVIVLHQGQIVEVGSHDELRALGGRYAAMWDAFERSTDLANAGANVAPGVTGAPRLAG